MRAVLAAIYTPRQSKVLEIQASLYRKTKSPFEPNICIQLFQESLSEKCTGQSRKVLWVVLSSMFFKEI